MMTATATQLDAARVYFDAWNRRDAGAIVAAFRPGGTYSDPAAGEGLTGEAIAGYAAGLFAAFPDLRFDLDSVRMGQDGTVIAEWRMCGTNTGPLLGGPPTGGTVRLPGLDILEVEGDRIASVRGYFDRQQFVEQLGLQAIALPHRLGPVTFGTAVRLEASDPATPGAMTLTMIEVRTEAEAEEVKNGTRQIMGEMGHMRGFLGLTAVVIGRRLYTITAWTDPEAVRQIHEGRHTQAARQVFDGSIGVAGLTGVWVPQKLIRRVRCPACGRWARLADDRGQCECGRALPDASAAW